MPPKTIRQLGGTVSVRTTKKKAPIVIDVIPTIPTTVKTLASLIPNLTPEQITKINTIQLQEPDYDEAVMTIIQTIDEIGFDETFKFLQSAPIEDRSRYIIFETPINQKLQEAYNLEVDLINQTEDVEEGIYRCPRCGSNKTISHRAQTRSADEGETVKVRCTQCGKEWRYY